MPPLPFQSFLSDLLEDLPQLPFFSAVNQFAQTPAQRQFFQSQFTPTFNEFQGRLGAQLQAGQMPTMRFTDFLKERPFTQRFTALPPSMRGGGFASRFAPRARSLFNF